ncbi:hypothetical protein AYO22_11036 [Fonsecaea multimorphosa]|nr:hypothetical protein AYO22_11036 [Fonsecaea multimorphosa]
MKVPDHVSSSRKIDDLEKRVQRRLNVVGDVSGAVNSMSMDETAPVSQQLTLDLPGQLPPSRRTLQPALPQTQISVPTWPPETPPGDSGREGNQQATSDGACTGTLNIFARRLGRVELEAERINELFETFFTSYVPYLSFLERRPQDWYFDQSPLLFWAIISVASRRDGQDLTLLRMLAQPVTKLAWEEIGTRQTPLWTIQGLLLLCTWPFPAMSLLLEDSPTWADIAMSLAIQRGLHRPERSGDFTRSRSALPPAMQLQMSRTWAACHITAQRRVVEYSVASTYGLFNSAAFDFRFSVFEEEQFQQSLAPPLRCQLTIQRFCGRACRTIFDSPIGLSGSRALRVDALIDELEAELDKIEKDLTGQISGITELYYLAAKVFLQTQQFFGTDMNADYRQRGVLKAYTAAVAFIRAATSAHRTTFLFDFIPNYLFRMLFNATCVIWKVLTSSYRERLDFQQGKADFNEGLSAVRKCSIENNDVAGRHAEILAQLWQISCGDGGDSLGPHDEGYHLRSRPPELGVVDRFGASLVFDCLFFWREHVGGQRRMGLQAATTGHDKNWIDGGVRISSSERIAQGECAFHEIVDGIDSQQGSAGDGHYVHRALLWKPQHYACPMRRAGFHSWSWTGWKGRIEYSYCLDDWDGYQEEGIERNEERHSKRRRRETIEEQTEKRHKGGLPHQDRSEQWKTAIGNHWTILDRDDTPLKNLVGDVARYEYPDYFFRTDLDLSPKLKQRGGWCEVNFVKYFPWLRDNYSSNQWIIDMVGVLVVSESLDVVGEYLRIASCFLQLRDWTDLEPTSNSHNFAQRTGEALHIYRFHNKGRCSQLATNRWRRLGEQSKRNEATWRLRGIRSIVWTKSD